MKNKIKETLLEIGAINNSTIETYSKCTRDKKNLIVYKDTSSGVIFIDDYYVGNEEYKTVNHRIENKPLLNNSSSHYELEIDSARREKDFKQFYTSKTICDFGCGAGKFLVKAKDLAKKVYGIEIKDVERDMLNSLNIHCLKSLEYLNDKIDTFFMFHTLEHLPNPINELKKIRSKITNNGTGKIIVEVPHANDFLLSIINLDDFKRFTLWSQHLILHTRTSLKKLLYHAGFKNIIVFSCQRYPLSNHLHWLSDKKPGGHKNKLSIIDNEILNRAYSSSLSSIDANDTLIAIADK